MKKIMQVLTGSCILLISVHFSFAQDGPIHPGVIKTAVAYKITKPLRDNPVVTSQEVNVNELYLNNHQDREINPNINPPDFDNMPNDPGEQTFPGWIRGSKAIPPSFKESKHNPDKNEK